MTVTGELPEKIHELFYILGGFLNDKPEMKLIQTVDGQAFVSYLTDISEKLNMLNKQLQGANKTLVHTKAKTYGFIAFLQLCQKNVSAKKNLTNFIGYIRVR
jgi:roadblock/LC7 domain-containing protein